MEPCGWWQLEQVILPSTSGVVGPPVEPGLDVEVALAAYLVFPRGRIAEARRGWCRSPQGPWGVRGAVWQSVHATSIFLCDA